jgi:hypothetical protein
VDPVKGGRSKPPGALELVHSCLCRLPEGKKGEGMIGESRSINRRQFTEKLLATAGLAGLVGIAGCKTTDGPPLTTAQVNELVGFKTVPHRPGNEGRVITAPFGEYPQSNILAERMSQVSGFGYVGVDRTRTSVGGRMLVHVPFEGTPPDYNELEVTSRAQSVYEHFLTELKGASGGRLDHYFSIRMFPKDRNFQKTLDLVTLGIWDEQATRIKEIYYDAAAKLSSGVRIFDMRVEPLDETYYTYQPIKNHGVLLLPNRSSILIAPAMEQEELTAYGEVLGTWAKNVSSIIGIDSNVEFISLIGNRPIRFTYRDGTREALVAAPHGGSDTFSDNIAMRIATHLGAKALIVHGHDGLPEKRWDDRLNVNRPTVGLGGYTKGEYHTSQAQEMYRAFEQRVARLVRPDRPYIEIHSNNHSQVRDRIEIATEGVSGDEAERLKSVYIKAYGKHATAAGTVSSPTPFFIEPNNSLTMNAYGAKQVGILAKMSRALHIEVPIPKVSKKYLRDAHTGALEEMIGEFIGAPSKPS